MPNTPVTKAPHPTSSEIQDEKQYESQFEDRLFISGPNPRMIDFRLLLGVLSDFIKGFRELHFVGPCITVFGSARFDENHAYYKLAREVGASIAKMGFTVMTGGGPGIMEAANRGAKDVQGHSVGCNIVLPMEQHENPYLDRWVNIRYFFVRKVLLMKYSYGFICMPGGYGTVDEMFEALTLIQTKKVRNFPVVLMGLTYWQPLRTMIDDMAARGTISPEDINLIRFTDSVDEMRTHLERHAVVQFKLRRGRIPREFSVLGESGLG